MTAQEWSQIVREHSPLVWQTAYRLLAQPADAADCLQETFVAAWAVAARHAVRNWPGLLQHLATARALDHLRGKQRLAKRVSALDVGQLASPERGPAAQAQLAELAEQLAGALADLPERQSTVYCLRHLNGMSYEEIAAELGMTVGAVGVTLHRATQRLRAALTPLMLDNSRRGGVDET